MKKAALNGVTGSDGSQTGTASFLGNFTAITQPQGNYFFIVRAADCSLNLISGTDVVNGSASVASGSANFERTLHQLAGLTTTPDLYPLGCGGGAAGVGLSTRFGVSVLRKPGAPFVLAGAGFGSALTFTVAHDLSSGLSTFLPGLTNASGVTTADLNGDGNGDLLVVNAYNATSPFVSVLLGHGDGTFASAVTYATGGSQSVAAVLDDVNGDGKLDIIAVANDQTVSILTGKGDGTFNAAQNFAAPLPTSSNPASTPVVNVITADVNGDGKKDIIGSNGLVLLGNGDGTFRAVATPAFPFTQGISSGGPNLAAGDVDKDGKVDLVLDNGNVVTIWKGNGDGTFRQGNAYTSIGNTGYVTLTDLDGDGNLDIYTGLSNDGYFTADDTNPASAYVLMGNGDGTFVGAPSAPAGYIGTNPLAVDNVSNLADVNGDGYPDLIVPANGTVSGQTAVFTVELGSAQGIFSPGATITAPASVTFSVSEFTSPVTESTTNLTPSSYVVSDVNGDGRPDVVYVSNYRGYAVYGVALGNGDGTFASVKISGFPQLAPATGYDIQTQVSGLRVGDFNHDGKVDVLFNFSDTTGGTSVGPYLQGLGVLPGDGTGKFGAAVLTATYSSATAPTNAFLPTPVAIADVNQDGLPDVVATFRSFVLVNGVGVTTSTVQVYLGKSDGSFTQPTAAITTTYLGQVAVADLNKDGKLDIAALTETSATQAQLTIALGRGDGTFATPALSNLAGGDAIRSAGLVTADFDNDGNTDLALLDSSDYSGIFYGKGDGTFTSVPLANNIVPKDLILIAASGHAVAIDLNKDGRPDILAGQAVLLNQSGAMVAIQFATSTALSVSTTSITSGASLTLTATIAGASGSIGTPSGTVTFSDGTAVLGTAAADSTGKATLSTTTLTSTGTHTLTAAYGGGGSFLASTSSGVAVSVTAPQPVATTTLLTAAPTSAVAGASIAFSATVSSASGAPPGTVQFLDGTTVLGTGTLDGSGKATYSTTALAVGSHSIIASFAGTTAFAASQSMAVPVTITAPVPADFTLSLNPSAATVAHGSSTTTTVTLTPTGGFSATTTLSCSGAPAKAACSISPGSVSVNGSATATATVTITTNNTTAELGHLNRIAYASLSVAGLLALIGFRRKKQRFPRALLLLLGSWAALSLSGCGGSSDTAAAGSYTLTVTGTAGSISHVASFTLNVQ